MALSAVVGGARAFPDDAGHIAGLVAGTSVVFWLAHVYSHALAYSVGRDEHLSAGALRGIARHEASVIEAAVPPLVPLLLGALGVLSASTAAWSALAAGLIVLAVQGIAFARVERLGWLGSLTVVALNLGLGVLLVGLKLVLTH